ncbi:SH3 domain-containing protein [Caulobacter sp. SL161]|uniref:SH3 domain-containing protein n=1 Tax=Caulobacter sp. SL161 TaxID=2995156 RepID=UPI002274AAE2|nr:SH3 domain-containing protein [Caulobacter sp. SL161]MCY1647790.1 SH3 domain-containing protein [Caulobacter sp. SL161]
MAGGIATRGQSENTQKTGILGGALLGGVAGGVDQYLDAKRQITQDNRQLVRLIDEDARGQAGRVGSMITSINSTGKCRQDQINSWEQRLLSTRTEFVEREKARAGALTSAADDKARRTIQRDNDRAARLDRQVLEQMGREEAQIRAAIKDDEKLYADVLKFFDSDIMAMAEAQARVEGTSPASLRGPAEAYTVQVVPPALLAAQAFSSTQSAFGGSGSAFPSGRPASPAPVAAAPPPPPPPSLYLQSTTQLRATAAAQGRAVASLPPGTPVVRLGEAEGAPGWIEVMHDGKTGFIQASRIGPAPPAGLARTNAGATRQTPVVAAAAPPPWQAQIVRPQMSATNGHQAALIAQRDAAAEAQAATQSAEARLQLAVQRGNEIKVGG